MRAMILAAGFGTRMRPLTDTIPKALAPVAGRPIIEYALLFLKSRGIEEVVINIHHLGYKLRETFPPVVRRSIAGWVEAYHFGH